MLVDDPRPPSRTAVTDHPGGVRRLRGPRHHRQGGRRAWYVSPMATVSDQLLAVTERSPGRRSRTSATRSASSIEIVRRARGRRTRFEVPELDDYELPDDDERAFTTVPVPDQRRGRRRAGRTVTATERHGQGRLDVRRRGVLPAGRRRTPPGVLPGAPRRRPDRAVEVPWYFRFPSAAPPRPDLGRRLLLAARRRVRGARRASWQPCFQALIAAGDGRGLRVRPSSAKPECLEGRNPYLRGPAYLDAYEDCAYG